MNIPIPYLLTLTLSQCIEMPQETLQPYLNELHCFYMDQFTKYFTTEPRQPIKEVFNKTYRSALKRILDIKEMKALEHLLELAHHKLNNGNSFLH